MQGGKEKKCETNVVLRKREGSHELVETKKIRDSQVRTCIGKSEVKELIDKTDKNLQETMKEKNEGR